MPFEIPVNPGSGPLEGPSLGPLARQLLDFVSQADDISELARRLTSGTVTAIGQLELKLAQLESRLDGLG